MAQTLTTNLVATTLQKLEAIRHNEAEVLSDEECYKRAAEVAEAALQAIAICTKYLLSRNAEARIDGFGNFYIEEGRVQFVPDEDVLQYALLKQQEPEQQQLALRNAFVGHLAQARRLIPLLDLASSASVSAEDSAAIPEEKLLRSIFGEIPPNNFNRTLSLLLYRMIRELREAGAKISLAEGVFAELSEQDATAPITEVEPIAPDSVRVESGDYNVWDEVGKAWVTRSEMERRVRELRKKKSEMLRGRESASEAGPGVSE